MQPRDITPGSDLDSCGGNPSKTHQITKPAEKLTEQQFSHTLRARGNTLNAQKRLDIVLKGFKQKKIPFFNVCKSEEINLEQKSERQNTSSVQILKK